MSLEEAYLSCVKKDFHQLQSLGEKAMAQCTLAEINQAPEEYSNSIAVIIKHMRGNMLSRWTDFLTTDGEKPNRNREEEFTARYSSMNACLQDWEEGWTVLYKALDQLAPTHLEQIITIRNEPHTILQAIQRQISHYAQHVGQIVYIAKMYRSSSWCSLSIPPGKSKEYNQSKGTP